MENDIEKNLAQQLQKQPGSTASGVNPDQKVEKAWDFSKTQTRYKPTDEEYWPSVVANTKNNLGMDQDKMKQRQQQMQPMQGIQPEKPVFSEDLQRAKKSGDKDREKQYQGLDRIEAAKEILANLKKKDNVDRNDMIFTLINRLNGITVEQAIAIVDNKGIEDAFKANYAPTSAFAPLGKPQQGDDVQVPVDVEDKSKKKVKD